MKNTVLTKILEALKNGEIDIQTAEKMICSGVYLDVKDLPWKDDKRLRLVAFKGDKLLKISSPEYTTMDVTYHGEALNVNSYGNLTCQSITGNVIAGASITCEQIKGNVTSVTGIRCKNINGKAVAGSRVYMEQDV